MAKLWSQATILFRRSRSVLKLVLSIKEGKSLKVTDFYRLQFWFEKTWRLEMRENKF